MPQSPALESGRWPGGPDGEELRRLAGAFIARGRKPQSVIDPEWLVFRGTSLRGSSVLDVGAGAGFASAYAAACGARLVVALEPEGSGSAAGAAGAFRSLHEELGYEDRVILIEESVESVPLDREFDVILLNASINHLSEEACARLHEDAAARALYRSFLGRLEALCKPGGKLIVVDCSNRNLFADFGIKNPVMTAIDWRIHQPPRLWSQLLEEVGFRRPQVDWLPLTRKWHLGPVLSAGWASYLLNSVFRLVVEKHAEE